MTGDSRENQDDALYSLPKIDSSWREIPTLIRRVKGGSNGARHGMHVLFNMAGTMLRRAKSQ